MDHGHALHINCMVYDALSMAVPYLRDRLSIHLISTSHCRQSKDEDATTAMVLEISC